MEGLTFSGERQIYYMERLLSQKVHGAGSAGIVFGSSGLGKTTLLASTAARTIEDDRKVCYISFGLAFPQFLDLLKKNLGSRPFKKHLIGIVLPIDTRYKKYYKKVPAIDQIKSIQLESGYTQFHLLDVILHVMKKEGCTLFLVDAIDDLDPFRIDEGVVNRYHINQFTASLMSNGISTVFTSVYNHQIQVNTRVELKEVQEREGKLQRVAIIHKGVRPSQSKEYINYEVHGKIVFDYSTARIV